MGAETKSIEVGDLVWAKMKGWSPWPGKVCRVRSKSNSTTTKTQFCVWFFGSDNYAWIDKRFLVDYHKFKDKLSKACRTAPFRKACDAIENYIARKAKGIDVDAELPPFLLEETDFNASQEEPDDGDDDDDHEATKDDNNMLVQTEEIEEMEKGGIRIGDLVWAKMKGWSPWPGKVCNPPGPWLPKSKLKSKKTLFCVWFFGSNNYGWIEEKFIVDYFQFKDRLSKVCQTTPFRKACKAIEDYVARKAQGVDVDAELFLPPAEEDQNPAIPGEKKDDAKPESELPDQNSGVNQNNANETLIETEVSESSRPTRKRRRR